MDVAPMLVVLLLSFGTVSLGTLYFRRWQVVRPPIGVFNLGDVAFMLVGILVVPLIYLAVPTWVLIGLMALGALSAISCAAEPIVRSSLVGWLLLVGIVVAEGWATFWVGPASRAFFVVNNLVIIGVAVSVANLWAQSGMKARDAAILGAALALYDLVATGILPLMGDLMVRTGTLPFAPIVAWQSEPEGAWSLIGMGDLLVSTVGPLVMRKAYGWVAGYVALVCSCLGIALVWVVASLGSIGLFPVMVVIGPLMVLQYLWWSRSVGAERTTRQYLLSEPIPA